MEIRSALCRLVREGDLDEKGFKQALKLAEKIKDRCSAILPTDALADLAEDCLDRYRLRAADALQLSAALVWCREKPAKRAFIAFDPGLASAARELGFDILD
ncbi:MAG TPA: type II toxin-antitoxin system VapC family toxin [Acidobacteriota bacterium]|nr:type II toxin-antitoxin system VapC family toxin [Acidobacteriota bacterium]